jgi:hypothetical protein
MTGLFCAAAALLLFGSGVAKLRTPDPSLAVVARLFRRTAANRSARVALVSVVAGVEVVAGAGFLALGGRMPAIAVAVLFAMFAGVAAVLLAASDRVACGCFGRADAPVGISHLAVNVLCCAAAVACAVRPVGPLGGLLASSGIIVIVGLVQVVLLSALGYLMMTALPALTAARRLGATP